MRLWHHNWILVIVVVFTLGLFSPRSAFAQQCRANFPIDLYECGEPLQTGSCNPPTYIGPGAVDCYTKANGECSSVSSICSSKDSCVPVYNNSDNELQCWCTNSVVQCNQSGEGV